MSNLAQDIEALFREQMYKFIEWAETEWKLTPEIWKKSFDEKCPQKLYFDGFNAGIEAMKGALDVYLDEHL